MKDAALYISDILDAFRAIREFVKGMDLEDFKQNDLVSSAVIRKFEIVGEAAKRVPESIKQRYPEIPWKLMAGMRDRLIHAYFDVNHELVWETIARELPRLEPLLQKVLRDLEGDRGR